jgi:hypothetical protein
MVYIVLHKIVNNPGNNYKVGQENDVCDCPLFNVDQMS